MKRVIFILMLFVGAAFQTQAQKYCTIDSKYILDKLPD